MDIVDDKDLRRSLKAHTIESWHGQYKYSKSVTYSGNKIDLSLYYDPKYSVSLSRRIMELLELFSWAQGPYTTYVSRVYCMSAREVTVYGKICYRGRVIGNFERYFTYDKHGRAETVKHQHFKIEDTKQQKRGFGRLWLAECLARYKALNFRVVRVIAGGENGSYTWAKLGFELSSERSRLLWACCGFDAYDIIRRAEQAGTDPNVIRIARDMVENGIPKDMSIQQVATLGLGEKWRDRKRNHLGKALLLKSNIWDGEYRLTDQSIQALAA